MRPAIIFLCGCIFGVVATAFTLNRIQRSPPAPPDLQEAESITIFLHPWGGYEAATSKEVRIPVDSQGEIFRRLVPETYYGNVFENVSPLVADAFITHADKSQTHVLVREGGHNPAIVSVDGVNYFYAKNEPGVYAGANELVRLVAEIAYKQEANENPE